MNELQKAMRVLNDVARGGPMFRSIPDQVFDSMKVVVRLLEMELQPGEQIAYVHGQTGEPIFVEEIEPSGFCVILWGKDSEGRKTSVVAPAMTLQVAFKVLPHEGERRPIGFGAEPSP